MANEIINIAELKMFFEMEDDSTAHFRASMDIMSSELYEELKKEGLDELEKKSTEMMEIILRAKDRIQPSEE